MNNDLQQLAQETAERLRHKFYAPWPKESDEFAANIIHDALDEAYRMGRERGFPHGEIQP